MQQSTEKATNGSGTVAGCAAKHSADGILLAYALLFFLMGYALLPPVIAVYCSGNSIIGGVLMAMARLLCLAGALWKFRCMQENWREVFRDLDLGSFPVRMLWMGLPLSVILTIVSGMLTWLWSEVLIRLGAAVESPITLKIMSNGSTGQVVSLIITALAAAPLFEEILFRRLLSKWCAGYWGYWGGATVTAAAFAAVHLSLVQLPGLMFMSMVWQMFYRRSGSLWSAVILHFFNNLLAVGVMLAARSMGCFA